MKKKIFLTMVAFTIVCVGGLLSCNSETDQIYARTENSKLDDFIEAAELHSIGLERYYEEVIAGNAQFTRAFENGTITRNLRAEVVRIMKDITTVDSRLEELVNKYGIKESPGTRSLGQYDQYIEHLTPFIENAFTTLEGVCDEDLLKTKINDQINSVEYKQFSQEEQDHLLFVFAVYFDSIMYWRVNIDKWFDVIKPVTRYPMSPMEREIWRDVAGSELGRADAWGAIKGAGLGAVGGFGMGFLGGWGGVAGLVVGWVTGGIDASISKTLEQA